MGFSLLYASERKPDKVSGNGSYLVDNLKDSSYTQLSS